MRRVCKMLVPVRNRLRCLWSEWFGKLATHCLLAWKKQARSSINDALKHEKNVWLPNLRSWLCPLERIKMTEPRRFVESPDLNSWVSTRQLGNCVYWGTCWSVFHWRSTPFATTPAAAPCSWSARGVNWVDRRRMGERTEPYQWVSGGHRHNTGKRASCLFGGGGRCQLTEYTGPCHLSEWTMMKSFSSSGHRSHNQNICVIV